MNPLYAILYFFNASPIAGLFTAVMPIATLIIAWLALNEVLTRLEWIGMIFILTAIVANGLMMGRIRLYKTGE